MPDDNSPTKSELQPSSIGGDSSQNDERPQEVITEDRTALIHKARAFLTSPQVRHEDVAVKRRFLAEKGLNEAEVDILLQQLPPQLPPIPPRTYPQPPPSNLPNLMIGMMKVMTWLSGGSAVLLLLYYKFLLPRLIRSSNARRTLKAHQASLLKRFNKSLVSLKANQTDTYKILPTPPPFTEDLNYSGCHDLDSLSIKSTSSIHVPVFSFLRCVFEDPAFEEKRMRTEDLFAMLEERYAWLKTEDGLQYETLVWDTLRSTPCFQQVEEDGVSFWTYMPAERPPIVESSVLTSLSSLKNTVVSAQRSKAPYQYTLQALTDLTGYLTTQTYNFSTFSYRIPGAASSSTLTPQQEDIRKEIRALKGLVLNRRTFAPHPVVSNNGPENTS